MKIEYKVEDIYDKKSLNTILTTRLNISARLLTKLIKNNKILLNKNQCDTRQIANLGDIIQVDFDYIEDNSNIIPSKINLDIIYEDEWMLVINKPAGIPIHPSRAHYADSISNAIKYYYDKIALHKKIRPVNRLDLDTSGIVIFAKCEYIQESFIKQMKQYNFQKEYICIVEGILKKKKGTIAYPIARKKDSIIERCVDKENGHPSITHYEVVKEFQNYSLVKCKLETGRTHQIRVHMKEIGHPIVGDTLYGTKSNLISRQALHSSKIRCIHPISKKELIFESKLPKDMEILIK